MRIPGVIDVVTLRDAEALRAAAQDARLDRPAPGHGPLLNRLIARAARDTLTAHRQQLPSALPRADYRRQDMRAALSARLDSGDLDTALAGPVARAATFVGGGPGKALELSHALIGPAVITGFTPTPESVAAAETIGRGLNGTFAQRLLDRITGRSRLARAALHGLTHGNLTAIHALGIAAQNMAASLEALREVPQTASAEAALAHALIAPRRVLRQGTAPAELLGGSIQAGTLVILPVGEAARRTLDPRVAFLSEAWSGCPAHGFVPAVLRRVWTEATGAP